jgi:uncharacterized protein YdiU (UPF0061 family)
LEHQLLAFYGELVERVARMAAEWMAAGFVHGVLNTDNMSLAGESFDYGPFAFLERWDPSFTAAYFDQTGLYSYGRQPAICRKNLQLLQNPLAMLLPRPPMEKLLERYASSYQNHYRFCLLRRMGLTPNPDLESDECLVSATLDLIANWPVGYGDFFAGLASLIESNGLPHEPEGLPVVLTDAPAPAREVWQNWRNAWWWQTQTRAAPGTEPESLVPKHLRRWNLSQTPTRALIESLWDPIDQGDDWQPLRGWLASVMKG